METGREQQIKMHVYTRTKFTVSLRKTKTTSILGSAELRNEAPYTHKSICL